MSPSGGDDPPIPLAEGVGVQSIPGGGADRLAGRRLYLCTPDRPDLAAFVAACIRGGVGVVQLRDKHLEARPLLARAKVVAAVCKDAGVPFILNDRPDLALEVGADGVHVGQDDAPPALARRILGPDAVIGLSTHAPDQFDRGLTEDVDYLSAGPVTPTPTAPDRPGTGLAYVTYAAQHTKMPFFVTGGASPETVGAMVDAGARRVVVVRWICEADEPEAAARALRRALDESLSRVA